MLNYNFSLNLFCDIVIYIVKVLFIFYSAYVWVLYYFMYYNFFISNFDYSRSQFSNEKIAAC